MRAVRMGLERAAAPGARIVWSDGRPALSPTALVVESDPSVRNLLGLRLKLGGFEVLEGKALVVVAPPRRGNRRDFHPIKLSARIRAAGGLRERRRHSK